PESPAVDAMMSLATIEAFAGKIPGRHGLAKLVDQKVHAPKRTRVASIGLAAMKMPVKAPGVHEGVGEGRVEERLGGMQVGSNWKRQIVARQAIQHGPIERRGGIPRHRGRLVEIS